MLNSFKATLKNNPSRGILHFTSVLVTHINVVRSPTDISETQHSTAEPFSFRAFDWKIEENILLKNIGNFKK